MNDPLTAYLSPDQATLLRYEGALPAGLRAELGARLRDELAALRTLVPEPLARDPAGFARRSASFWAGSLLYADLSGFTALTEELAAHGLRGTEELCAIINQLFGALLEELHAYGGVVLKFGGDALTGFFAAGQGGPGHSLAACAAALAMQRRMAAFADLRAYGRSHRLRLRIGVHVGRPFGAIVGDAERREVVVTGRAVNRVAGLQERAAPGEVIVSAETVADLRAAGGEPRLHGQALRDLAPVAPAPAPALPALPADDDLATLADLAGRIAELRPFLPGPLPRHVLLPAGRAGGEFRPVSALFINVTSLGGVLSILEALGRPPGQALSAYYGHIQRVIRRHGGEINKLDVSSVGDKLLATFGAPVAHEDDPRRAVAAALELGPALERANQELRQFLDGPDVGPALWRTVDLALRQRVGVATGNVFAGAVGSPSRREYTVIGQTVNLAARLMAGAEPGQVLIAPATAAAAAGRFTLATLPPRRLKGFARPVAAAAVLQRADDPAGVGGPETPLVGRERELALLRDLAPATPESGGRVVVVSGEAGIGKSRLIGAFWAELAERPLRRIAISGRAYAQNSPYNVIRDMLAQLFGLPEDAEAAALRAALAAVVDETAPAFAGLAPLLDAVFALAPADQAAPAGHPRAQIARLPEAERRERLHDLIVALTVGALQQRPLALLIDDLHWVDASSIEIVQRLCQLADGLPLLLVLSYRPAALPGAPWADLPQTHTIALEGLDRASSRRLLENLLGGPPDGAAELILDRAQGSPLFLEALARHLIERGMLRRDPDGAWQIAETLADTSVPQTIELVLAAQIDRLDEASRELVQVAAVIGQRVPYRVLAGVYSQARRPAHRIVELVRAGILAPDERAGRQGFRFRQTLLRDVAYQSILYEQRRELHRRVAERIESVFAEQLDRFAAELAHHYAQAEAYPRAFAYALRAADKSRAQHALAEALAGYRQAWQIAARHPDAIGPDAARQAREALADVAALAGRYEQADRHYHALLEGAAGLPAAALARKLGGLYEQQSLFEQALEWLHHARRRIDELGRGQPAALVELSRICSAIGWVYFRRGEPERARQWLDEAIGALGDRGDEEALQERARVYNRLGGVAWMLGNLRAARLYVERSLADFAAADDLPGRADAQNNLGILAEQLGDWPGAIASYQAALEMNQQIGRRRAAALSRLNLGAAHLQLGEPARALPLLEQATVETRALGDTVHEVMALRWLGRAYIRLDQLAPAQDTLQRALGRARASQLRLDQLDTYTALGELAQARVDPEAALAAYRAGQGLLDRVDHETLEVGLFLRFAAQVEAAAGDPARSAALRSRSQRILRKLGLEAPPDS